MAVEPRVAEYAELLVGRCLDVQPGWQVLIRSQPAARPVLEEMMRLIAGRGAFPLLRLNYSLWPADEPWAETAPAELVGELSEIDLFASDHMDARVTMEAPDNTRGVVRVAARTPCAGQEGLGAVLPADDGARDPVGQLPVPHAGARTGGRDVGRRVRAVSSTGRCCATGTPRRSG